MFVDFNDKNITLGKRKVAYVKYVTSKYGTSLIEAQRQANKKFGYDEKSLANRRCLICGLELENNGMCSNCTMKEQLI